MFDFGKKGGNTHSETDLGVCSDYGGDPDPHRSTRTRTDQEFNFGYAPLGAAQKEQNNGKGWFKYGAIRNRKERIRFGARIVRFGKRNTEIIFRMRI